MLAPPLADFLRVRRADCNARFALARRRWPRLDAADFSLFLRDQLSPLASALALAAPTRVSLVLDRAYDLGLELVAGKLAGPGTATNAVNALWKEVFPSLAVLFAAAPRRLPGALCNAAHHLAATPHTRAAFWRAKLVAVAPQCTSADELLIVAQVLAWRAGLAHYRAAALAAADTLPPALALAALDAPPGSSWPAVRDAHLSDPWHGYDACQQPLATASIQRRVGAFRGFGGLFLTPPLVTRSGGHLLVCSGDEAWILFADAFGATLHRAASEEITAAAPVSAPSPRAARLPAGHVPTSAVTLDATSTYAVTSAQSHAVLVGPLKAS